MIKIRTEMYWNKIARIGEARWMSPDGQLFPTDYHRNAVERLLTQYKLPVPPNPNTQEGVQVLLSHGFLRIVMNAGKEGTHMAQCGKMPTDAQINNLATFFVGPPNKALMLLMMYNHTEKTVATRDELEQAFGRQSTSPHDDQKNESASPSLMAPV
jgi:hypothetical protein